MHAQHHWLSCQPGSVCVVIMTWLRKPTVCCQHAASKSLAVLMAGDHIPYGIMHDGRGLLEGPLSHTTRSVPGAAKAECQALPLWQ